MKRQIVIEIDASSLMCSYKCLKIDFRDGYCSQFKSHPESRIKKCGDTAFKRLPECLAAEQKAKGVSHE